MTGSYTAEGIERIGSDRTYRFSILRVIFFSALLTALIGAELYLHHTALDLYHSYLITAEKKSTAWMELQLSYMLPFITVCLFQYFVYHKDDRQDGILRREMAWEVVLVAVLTYAVLLPCVAHMSTAAHDAAVEAGKDLPMTAQNVENTLLMQVHDWFIRFSVPLMLLCVYHFTRAEREAKDATKATVATKATGDETDAAKAEHAAATALPDASAPDGGAPSPDLPEGGLTP